MTNAPGSIAMSSTVTESLRGEACSFTNIGLHCSDYEAEDH
jgi:hypothetical protein